MSRSQTGTGPWIAPDESPPFEIVNGDGRGRAILTCDHASARIPRRLGSLGLSQADLARHVACDRGAAAVARGLSQLLDSPLILSGYSRLVVDCNRPLEVPDAFATKSEDVEIPGNKSLYASEKAERADAFYWPYHDVVHRLVESRMDGDVIPALVSIHSFTPVYLGQSRPWHIGVHYRLDRRLAALALKALRAHDALCVGENEPYPVALDEDYTVPVHAEIRGLPYVLFEIRQDLITSDAEARAWAERLGAILEDGLHDPSLDHLAQPAPDVREPRYENPVPKRGSDHVAK